MLDLETQDDLTNLADLGFLRPKFFNRHHWAAIILVGSFAAIVDGDREALTIGYRNRWSYPSLSAAAVALMNWSDGDKQPQDWIGAKLAKDGVPTVWP